MNSLIPWWFKIAAKIVLSRLPFNYHIWQKIGLFRHGSMDRVEYVLNVFQGHVSRAGLSKDLESRVIIELGPGDSIATALVANCFGARAILVDGDAYAVNDVHIYHSFTDELAELGFNVPDFESAITLNDILDICNATYRTRGLESLYEIESDSVDLIFSQAVLEHVRKYEFLDIMKQCHRILKSDGIASHTVDLKDHLSDSLNNLRFSEEIWESDFLTKSGFYTNRIRYTEMLGYFELAGFEVEVLDIRRWDELPINQSMLADPYCKLSENELMISGFDVLLHKK